MATLTVPDNVPSAEEDCAQLKKAFDGWGTDEAKIISILGHRNATQRKMIQQTYAEKYGQDLLTALDKELSSCFQRAVILWTLVPAERDALLANEATRKKSSKHSYVLMEIACTRTPQELFLVRQTYIARYKRSLEEDVAHHFTGDRRKLLVPLLMAYRHDGPEVNTSLAKSEAKILNEKISGKAYYHEELIRILTTRSKVQLRATLNQYNDQFGSPINTNLKKNPKDEDLAFLRATIKCLTIPETYFRKVLRQAILGLGTDEEALTRVVVTQAEFSMKRIMEEYQRRYSEPLERAIKGDTSGDYEKMLLTLIGVLLNQISK